MLSESIKLVAMAFNGHISKVSYCVRWCRERRIGEAARSASARWAQMKMDNLQDAVA
jgi:hypothetical protein